MLMRNSNTGVFEVFDIRNNAITAAVPMGQVGLEWSIAGFGDFSAQANETDMLMRNSNTGVFEAFRHPQQRDHLGEADGPSRTGMVGGRIWRLFR